MTYAAILEELRQRSGLDLNQFADAIRYSRPHLSHVILGTQPGSAKMLEAALRLVKIELPDCIVLPLNEDTKSEEELALETIRAALGLGAGAREMILAFADSIRAHVSDTRMHKLSSKKKAKRPPGRKTGTDR